MSHRLTGSRTDIAEAGCLYWAREDIELPVDVMGPAADEGVRLHALAEYYVSRSTNGAPPVGADIALRWATLRPWLDTWLAATPEDARLIEAGYALDVERGTVRAISREAGRDYKAGPNEVPARLDLGVVWDDRVEVWDLKTGETSPRAAESGQLRTLATLLARATGRMRAHVHIVHVRAEGVYVDSCELDAWDIDSHAVALRDMVRSIPTAQPKPGAHCKYCPKRTDCPAIVSAMIAAPSMAIATPEDVARVWPLLGPIQDALDAVKAAARAAVEAAGEVPLLNGKRLRIVRSGGGESVDIKALAAAVGDEQMNSYRASGVVKTRAGGSYVKEVR